ncbi:MAG: hypothetical protein HGA31_01420 [Candidatus Moranbacteria bacterium]|nr:hypothetical protein [Candidatus Moranbacteria bacterium]
MTTSDHLLVTKDLYPFFIDFLQHSFLADRGITTLHLGEIDWSDAS